jgi:fumarate reductase subunit D
VTTEPPSLRRSHFLLAVFVAAVFILWAPFIGQFRSALRAAFPGQFGLIVNGVIAVAIVGAIAAGLARIRERRAVRYGAIAVSVIAAFVYGVAFRTGNPEVDAVERFHFVEYGLVTMLFYRAWRPLDDLAIFILPVLAGILVGTVEEWFQWFIPARIGEVRDVFLNLYAIACGLLFSVGVDPPEASTVRYGSGMKRVARLAAVVALVFGMFLAIVHLGYDVHDSKIGSFSSRYSAAGLKAEERDRAERWRLDPPITWRRLSREDQYLSEAIWHVQRRNERWDAGDVFAAWRENLILETFYSPVLDTPSYISREGHRWPLAQRADAEHRAGESQAPYASDAHPYPILTWSKTVFWSVVLIVVTALAAFSSVR